MSKHEGSFDFILDAISAEHDINAYIQLLRRDGNITLVGAPDKPHAVSSLSLLFKRRSLSGSLIGVLPKRRICSTFAANITSLLTQKSFQSKKLTRLIRDCPVRM
jgi:uncharacterized zinc-type alcohol dehydrogenase-like protein